ncbi:456_t:CDS:2, partial [Racocetra fulgida]
MSALEDDRVYMDIDDEWALQDITSQIAQFRKDIALETQYEKHAKKSNLIVIMPWIVLEELDGLKSRSNNSYANSSKLNQLDVSNLAQRAISFLHNCLAEKHDGIRGQKIHEKIEKPKACGSDGLLEKILSTVNSSPDTVLYKQSNSVIQWPNVNELETNVRENHNGLNVVYNIKEEPECFDTDTIMMDCDDAMQKATSFSQNVIPESSEVITSLQTPQPSYSRPPLYSHENQCNPSYLSLYDSIHAPDNRGKKLEVNNQKNKDAVTKKIIPSTVHSNPKKFLMDDDDTKRISESYTTTHGCIPSNVIQNSPLSPSYSIQASYSPFSTQDELKHNSSLYASIHAPENLDVFTNHKTSSTSHTNNKMNREADVISMMLFTTPSVSKKLLTKTIETSHKRLVNKIMANLSNALPPAILFHFQEYRYWMTVFSDVFHQSRKIKEVVITNVLDFLRIYQRSDVADLTIQEVMHFIQNSELILKMIYDDIEETIDSA